jgi:curved DNA-binding protein CbpA
LLSETLFSSLSRAVVVTPFQSAKHESSCSGDENMSVPDDPYLVLDIPRTASSDEIKRAYRAKARQCHPDRRRAALSGESVDDDTCEFSQLAAAYALLIDPRRKAHYDHVFKYGGYDDVSSVQQEAQERGKQQQKPHPEQHQTHGNKPGVSIGYTCTDPLLSFLWTQGKIQTTRTVAGIQIPNRFGLQKGVSSFRVAISSGQSFSRDPATGKQAYRSQTTQFADGQKFTRSETTIMHPDGLREVLVVDTSADGAGSTRRYIVPPPERQQRHAATTRTTSPWYMNAWWELKDKFSMCYSPCALAMVH